MVVPMPAAVRLNFCVGCFSPPANADSPNTSSTLPMIDPVSDALTRAGNPSFSASAPMISSTALPNVAFINPPMPPPNRDASTSVARPM